MSWVWATKRLLNGSKFKNKKSQIFTYEVIRGWNSPPAGNGKKTQQQATFFSQTILTLILVDTPCFQLLFDFTQAWKGSCIEFEKIMEKNSASTFFLVFDFFLSNSKPSTFLRLKFEIWIQFMFFAWESEFFGQTIQIRTQHLSLNCKMNLIVSRVYIHFIVPKFIKRKKKKDPFFRIAQKKCKRLCSWQKESWRWNMFLTSTFIFDFFIQGSFEQMQYDPSSQYAYQQQQQQQQQHLQQLHHYQQHQPQYHATMTDHHAGLAHQSGGAASSHIAGFSLPSPGGSSVMDPSLRFQAMTAAPTGYLLPTPPGTAAPHHQHPSQMSPRFTGNGNCGDFAMDGSQNGGGPSGSDALIIPLRIPSGVAGGNGPISGGNQLGMFLKLPCGRNGNNGGGSNNGGGGGGPRGNHNSGGSGEPGTSHSHHNNGSSYQNRRVSRHNSGRSSVDRQNSGPSPSSSSSKQSGVAVYREEKCAAAGCGGAGGCEDATEPCRTWFWFADGENDYFFSLITLPSWTITKKMCGFSRTEMQKERERKFQ